MLISIIDEYAELNNNYSNKFSDSSRKVSTNGSKNIDFFNKILANFIMKIIILVKINIQMKIIIILKNIKMIIIKNKNIIKISVLKIK